MHTYLLLHKYRQTNICKHIHELIFLRLIINSRLRIQAAVPETPVQSWSGRIPHATEQLSPWATTTEPVPWGLALQLEKPAQQAHTARSPHSKKPAQRS